ncbi:MAG: hypothetical protein WCG48_01035 [Candidatus Berkelbacteria bacterium]
MNDIKKQTPLIITLVFVAVVAIGFFWSWSNAIAVSEVTPASDDYATIDINSYKTQVDKIMTGRQNLVGMPLAAPTEGVGRTNPFTGL